MRPLRSVLIVVLVVGAVACTRGAAPTEGTGVRSVSEPLPVLRGDDLQGNPISSTDLAGKVLVVNTWASWCTPCQQEQPDLVAVADRYAKRGVAFLGINHMDQTAQAQEWVRRYHVPYPSIADPSGRFAASFDYVGLPDTYVVDASGTIRFAIGPGATTATQLSGLLDQMLAAQTSASIATATNSPAR
ncbi:MAG: TlpA disulfide reductase family protein [Actinomycetota bacterium]